MKKSDIIWNLLLVGSLVGYFLVMRLLGLHQILALRYVNLAVHFCIVYLAMKAYRWDNKGPFSFAKTSMAGVRATVPAIIAFAVFQFCYLRFIDPGFMLFVQENAPMGAYLTPALVAVILVAEGLVATFFNSYVGMRLIAAQEHSKFPKM